VERDWHKMEIHTQSNFCCRVKKNNFSKKAQEILWGEKQQKNRVA